MNNFADRLKQRIQETGNPTVLGLDPLLDYIPDSILNRCLAETEDSGEAAGLALFEFNKRLIDSVAETIPAVKPQLAYYEKYGVHGLKALQKTIAYAHAAGMLVIADGKRNDIGSTADAYADAWLGQTEITADRQQAMFDADALTVNAYLGIDGIQPFINRCSDLGKGIFILVRTSNPSAGDLQDLILRDGRHVYEAMADKVSEWGEQLVGECGYSSVGAVVGATWPLQASSLRKRMPKSLILVPGYGAQGGSAADTVNNFGSDGYGAIVNASRSLMLAWKRHNLPHEEFEKAIRLEALRMKADLRQALEKAGRPIV